MNEHDPLTTVREHLGTAFSSLRQVKLMLQPECLACDCYGASLNLRSRLSRAMADIDAMMYETAALFADSEPPAQQAGE